jgi:peptidyl-prolyl cis-trans isomerase C
MKVSLLHSISLISVLTLATPLYAADPVVADVDGQKFTYSQVMAAKESLPKQYQSAPDDKIFPILQNQAVDTYLIEKAAIAKGVEKQPDVVEAIKKATAGIVAQAYLFGQVKVTDAQVKEKYDELVKNFPKEEEIHLRHILVEDEKTGQSVIKALKNGTEFKKLAQQKSKDNTAKDGGDLGFFRKSELPKELADAAFALKPGTFSQEPVKTDFGWHVLLVEEIRPAKPPKYDEIKNELKTLMTQEAMVKIVKDLRAKAKVVLFDKDGKPVKAKAEAEEKKPAEEKK